MEEDFEEIFKWSKERIQNEVSSLFEVKKEIRQIEGLLIGIVLLCIFFALIAEAAIAKYIFITVAILMFICCTIYSFKNETRITEKQNRFSEVALAELATHIKDGFTYEENEEIPSSYYKKSGFDRIYTDLTSKGVISGIKRNRNMSVANIIVSNSNKVLFKGIFAYVELKHEVDEIDVMSVNSTSNRKQKFEIPKQNLYMYSEDTNKSRQIITDEVLEDLNQFRKNLNLKFEFMMNQNLLFFRFFDNDILTKPLANNSQTKKYLYKYYQIIEFLSYFTEKIDR